MTRVTKTGVARFLPAVVVANSFGAALTMRSSDRHFPHGAPSRSSHGGASMDAASPPPRGHSKTRTPPRFRRRYAVLRVHLPDSNWVGVRLEQVGCSTPPLEQLFPPNHVGFREGVRLFEPFLGGPGRRIRVPAPATWRHRVTGRPRAACRVCPLRVRH